MRPVAWKAPIGIALLGGLLTLVACARVRPLEGGPADEEPPRLIGVVPADSSRRIPLRPRLELHWSENVSEPSIRRGLRTHPPLRIDKLDVRGSRVVIEFADSLPPDTTFVVVLGLAIQDRPPRDNKLRGEIVLLYTTGDTLRSAAVFGRVQVQNASNPHAVVVWQPVPEETLTAAQERRLPRAACDPEGLFRFLGLPPHRPFRLLGFLDQNQNGQHDDAELVAAFPETLQLDAGEVRRGLSWNIFDPKEPGRVHGVALNRTEIPGPLALAIRPTRATASQDSLSKGTTEVQTETDSIPAEARADTTRPLALPVPDRDTSPWGAAYRTLEPRGFIRSEWQVVYASPRGDYSLQVAPGWQELVAFVDARRDSVPGLYVAPDSSRLVWEPFRKAVRVQVPPGGTVRPKAIEIEVTP